MPSIHGSHFSSDFNICLKLKTECRESFRIQANKVERDSL